MEKYDWIIGICNTNTDGVRIFKFHGSKEDVKKQLLSLIMEDRGNDRENWDYGCESEEDIRATDNGSGFELYGYGNYIDYHIDYTAKEAGHIETVSLVPKNKEAGELLWQENQ